MCQRRTQYRGTTRGWGEASAREHPLQNTFAYVQHRHTHTPILAAGNWNPSFPEHQHPATRNRDSSPSHLPASPCTPSLNIALKPLSPADSLRASFDPLSLSSSLTFSAFPKRFRLFLARHPLQPPLTCPQFTDLAALTSTPTSP